MNLSEALDAALPEIPKARLSRARPPRLDPELVTREDTLDGEPVVGVLQRGKGAFFRFQPSQWQLAQLFDGVRSYEEIALAFNQSYNGTLTTREVEEFAASLDEADFWFKTAQEKNLAYGARLRAQRGRRANRRSKIDLAHISFSAWDPDRYLTWLDGWAGGLLYSRWCVLTAVLLFCFEAVVFVVKWKDFGADIPLYYNFTQKTFLDFVEFWVLLFVLGFIHESAHGLTCKHYGGQVHNMGLMFLYLAPAFFVDVTETWVSATRIQRLATIIAGIWIEMVLCGMAMLVWLNTQAGAWAHDLAYKVILITGLAVIVLNLNPLLKLDGYYFLTEILGIPDLKERSTSFVTCWLQQRVLRLPVEVPAVPRRRVPLFLGYALASGAYSYLMLFFAVRFSYNVTSRLLAGFALIPAAALGLVIFRSRLKTLGGVLRRFGELHLRKSFWLRPRVLGVVALILVLLFAPLLRGRENAYFEVEAADPVTMHAAVNGRVDAVYVEEGQQVRRGEALLRISSSEVGTMRSSARAATGEARFDAFAAEMEGQSIGTAAADQKAARRSRALAREAAGTLLVRAPVDGRVLTRRPAWLAGQWVGSGQPLLRLARSAPGGQVQRTLRVYLPAGELDRVQTGDEVALAPPGEFAVVRLRLTPLDGETATLPPGLLGKQKYQGIALPTFYSARLMLPPGTAGLELGATGVAKVFGERRSLAARLAEMAADVMRAHVW